MELTVGLVISIIGCVIAVCSFVLTRRDKSDKDVKEEQKQFDSHKLMDYRLEQIEKKLEMISNKLDFYDSVIEEKVEKRIATHEMLYHNSKIKGV